MSLAEGQSSGWVGNRVKWSKFLTQGMIAKFSYFFKECFVNLQQHGLEKLMNCDIHVDNNLVKTLGRGFYSGPSDGDNLYFPAAVLLLDGDQHCKDTILHEIGHRFYSYGRLGKKEIYTELTEKYLEYFDNKRKFPTNYSSGFS